MRDFKIPNLLLSSVMGIVISILCLMGTTYAWFTSTMNLPSQVIRGANYMIEAEIIKKDEAPMKLNGVDGRYEIVLSPGEYTVHLSGNGTATTGYCMIRIGEDIYYTSQIPTDDTQDQSMTITLYMGIQKKVAFTPSWGILQREEGMRIISNGDVILVDDDILSEDTVSSDEDVFCEEDDEDENLNDMDYEVIEDTIVENTAAESTTDEE